MSEGIAGQDIPTSKPRVTVDTELLARLTQPSEAESNIFGGDSFYRYPEQFKKIEDHMRNHIQSGKGDYLVLSVGASTGKEPLSAVISWMEKIKEINPEFDGKIGVLAVEQNPQAIAAFQQNEFPIFNSRDQQVDRVMRYVSKTTPAADSPGPAFIKPDAFVSFPEEILNKITYLQMNAESPQVKELPGVFNADSFNAVVCHTTSRYFSNEAASMERISSILNNGGLLSHVK